ncbi:ATP-dependent DNA helicase [Azohydromonas aeria]|uniref:ATP-dependent DNA helicase n=1 Tax=Azohydromonas aeria TaxID=2590212 RepID=UPI0012F90377|nr:ATP-dependent DNA helicase [Azohydromonas aeria]
MANTTTPDDAAVAAASDVESGALAQAVSKTFGADGALAQADPNYVQRPAQQQMALAVAQAIERREALVAEAGTGIGKTFAYLVPLLLSGARALVSTATKNLQDQLYLRDLPRLRAALGQPVSLALLKGRASYLCRHRLELARAGEMDARTQRALARIELWSHATVSGDLAELDLLDERSPLLPLVSSTRENCLGGECPQFTRCHVMRARREAVGADVVVVNHHLFFADLALRDSGVAELLPTVDVAVFDEAHQLVEAGVQFLGTTLGSAQLLDFSRDLRLEGAQPARGLAAWDELATRCETAARELRLHAAGTYGAGRMSTRLAWSDREGSDAFHGALQGVADACGAAQRALEPLAGSGPDLQRLHQRAQLLAERTALFAAPASADQVRWIDIGPAQVRLVESPLDIRNALTQQREAGRKAWIFTSATLGADAKLSWFTGSTALEDARVLRLDSPFDYAAHARLWIPDRFAAAGTEPHAPAVGRLAARLASALGGRTFVLTTTLRALSAVASALREELAQAGVAIDVLVQGELPKRQLVRRFLAHPQDSVLVGSASFWEGIDVPGDALQCVLIDKLPFPPPGDPLVEARAAQLEAQGKSAFNAYFLAEAAVSLKQGAGRLIRSERDRGLLVVCDPRLAHKGYGARLRRALPPMTRLQEEGEALAWLRELAAGRADAGAASPSPEEKSALFDKVPNESRE